MENKKQEILKKLNNTYCRFKPSGIQGVGVFAIRDIPDGVNPFQGIHVQKWIEFNMYELQELDKEILQMIDDFCVVEKDGSVLIPENGLNGMDISFFLNHSSEPNLKTVDEGFTFVTLRNISKGEELTVGYETYDHKYR